MNYTEVQIRQADAALRLMHETKGSVDGHDIYQVMGPPKAEYMRMVLCDVLHLTVRSNSMYALTEEGEKAYEMGFKAWLEERERKAQEPKKVMLIEKKFLGLSRSEWIAIIGIAIGLLGFLAGFLR